MTEQPPKIPAPKIEVSVADTLAAGEVVAFASRSEFQVRGWDWWQRFVFRLVLFFFVLGINIWWSWKIMSLLQRSGSGDGKFHLDDSVLIALVTTSIANFLALVIILAKNLFPGSSKESRNRTEN